MEWRSESALVPYEAAIATMESRVAAIREVSAAEIVWLLEHPPLYTAGTSANATDLLDARFPVYEAGRGGEYTYHGPGQRVGYVMLDLKARGGDVRGYVRNLEQWIIDTLACFGVTGERREGRVGVWVERDNGSEQKIAALGVRVRKWVTFHGISINRNPDLTHYAGIVPCGISEHGVTSLHDLGVSVTTEELDAALLETFENVLGRSLNQSDLSR